MTIFAIIKNNVVENIAEAESLEIMQLLLPNDNIVEETAETSFAWIGSEFMDGVFKAPPSYAEGYLNTFTPPIEMPTDGQDYMWDESSQSWLVDETAP